MKFEFSDVASEPFCYTLLGRKTSLSPESFDSILLSGKAPKRGAQGGKAGDCEADVQGFHGFCSFRAGCAGLRR